MALLQVLWDTVKGHGVMQPYVAPSSAPPIRIAAGETYTVSDNTQQVFAQRMVVDGQLIIDGTLAGA